AMDQPPLGIAHPDRDRLHSATAVRRAVARTLVDMHAPEAARAVVAVLRAVRLPDDVRFAVDASERLAFRVLRFGIHEKKRAIRTAGNGRYSFTASMNMNSPGTR